MKMTSSRIALFALVAGMSCLSTGCVSTFKEVKPLAVGPPPASRPTALALGEVKVSDLRLSEPEQQDLAHALERGVQKWCAEHQGLEVLKHVAATNLPPDAIVLCGTITEVEKGSAAARFWVGMGAGQQRVQGAFELRRPDGAKLTAFTARKSYLGGTGIGGFDMLSLEDLVDQLGQLAAQTTDKWLSGARLN